MAQRVGIADGPEFRIAIQVSDVAVLRDGPCREPALWSGPAHAVVISVLGTRYDIRVLKGPVTLDANEALLTDPVSAPWWGVTPDGPGGAVDAGDFAQAFNIAGLAPTIDFDPVNYDLLFFAYAEPIAGTLNTVFVGQDGSVSSSSFPTGGSTTRHHFAYAVPVTPAAVPEIDGNALVKALFCLFALGVWLQARRGRVARVGI